MDAAKQRKILLVEDEIIIASMEIQQLEREGYKVLHAMRGEEALKLVAESNDSIDIILMDIDLGRGLDGTEVAREILKNYDIPILFLSSRSEKETIQKTERITSYGYIAKNSNLTVINASIKMAFKLHEANQKIQKKSEQLETILQSIGDAVIATDLDGKVIKMNPIAEILTGWKFEEAEGKSLTEIFDIVNAHTRKKVSNPVDSVIQTGSIVGLANHTVLISKNKKEFQISDSGSPIKNFQGKVTGVVLVFRDVTHEYEIQRKIEESETLYHSLFENMINGFAYYKMIFENGKPIDFIYLSVNPALERLTGLKNLVGKKVSEVFPGIQERDPNLFEIFGRVSLTSIPERFETFVESLNMWFAISVYSPAKEYFVTIFDVITERKNAESALRASEEKYSILFKKASIPAALTKLPENTFADVNEAFESIFEFTKNDVIGKTAVELGIVRQEDQEPTVTNINKNGFEYNVEKRIRTKSGQKRIVLVNIEKVSFGGSDYAISTMQDVTESKVSEEKIQKLLEEKEIILKEVHHRIKNNMYTILSLLSIQSMNQENIITKNVLMDAASRVKSMMIMYDKLYRSENTKEASLRDYFITLIEEIISTFPEREFIKIQTDIVEVSLQPIILAPLGILLNELITNSMKYAFIGRDDGVLSVSAFIDKDKLLIIFEDNGPGIPEDINLETSTGFGLRLIGMQVKQLNGSVAIDRNNGTKFLIEIEI